MPTEAVLQRCKAREGKAGEGSNFVPEIDSFLHKKEALLSADSKAFLLVAEGRTRTYALLRYPIFSAAVKAALKI